MGVQIDKDIDTLSGLIIPKGSVVTYEPSFILTEKTVCLTLRHFLNVSEAIEGKNRIKDTSPQIKKALEFKLTQDQIIGKSNPLIVIDNYLLSYLQEIYGAAECKYVNTIKPDLE